jgi:hypothetical protein
VRFFLAGVICWAVSGRPFRERAAFSALFGGAFRGAFGIW